MPVVALAEVCGLAWLAEHIVEVAAVSAVCGALAVAAVVVLMRWCDRRETRHAAAASLWSVREMSSLAVTNLPRGGANVTAVCDSERPGLGFRDLHLHLDGVMAAEQAAVIRQALGEGLGQ